MVQAEVRLVWKLLLTDLGIMVLLLLTGFCGGQSVSSQSVVAMIGDDVTLPCQLDPVVDATGLTVEWARPDLQPRFVHLRREGVELVLEENPSYKGRTSLNENKLKRGDLSLKLLKVKLSDAGKYKCFVPTLDMESVVELVVGSVSSPHIQVSKVNNGGVVECKSSGWYPEPEVVWLDAEGKLLSEPKETTRGGDGLYTVSSRVTVEKKHSNGFTCRVQQQNISQTRETRIQVPADLFMLQFSSAVRFSIVVAVSFMVAVAVFITVWKVGQDNKETTKTELQLVKKQTELQLLKEQTELQLLKEQTELQLLKEQTELQLEKKDQIITDLKIENMRHLEKIKVSLELRSKRVETDIEEVEQIINEMKNKKTVLNVINKEVVKQLYVDKEIEDFEKEMKKNRKFQKYLDLVLETRKKQETLLMNTDIFLQVADDLEQKMAIKTKQLKKDKDQINIDLKEAENEMIQRKLLSKQQQEDESRADPSSSEPLIDSSSAPVKAAPVPEVDNSSQPAAGTPIKTSGRE